MEVTWPRATVQLVDGSRLAGLEVELEMVSGSWKIARLPTLGGWPSSNRVFAGMALHWPDAALGRLKRFLSTVGGPSSTGGVRPAIRVSRSADAAPALAVCVAALVPGLAAVPVASTRRHAFAAAPPKRSPRSSSCRRTQSLRPAPRCAPGRSSAIACSPTPSTALPLPPGQRRTMRSPPATAARRGGSTAQRSTGMP